MKNPFHREVLTDRADDRQSKEAAQADLERELKTKRDNDIRITRIEAAVGNLNIRVRKIERKVLPQDG